MTFTDQYGRTITGVDNGDGTTTYSVNGGPSITDPNTVAQALVLAAYNAMAPSVLPLGQAIQQNLSIFSSALSAYTGQYFTNDQKIQFIVLWLVSQNLPNRISYMTPLFNWVVSVSIYAASYAATVSAMTDPSTVMAFQPDFQDNIGAPPNVTLAGALAINN